MDNTECALLVLKARSACVHSGGMRGRRGLVVMTASWLSLDRQFEPYLRANTVAPSWCGLGCRSRTLMVEYISPLCFLAWEMTWWWLFEVVVSSVNHVVCIWYVLKHCILYLHVLPKIYIPIHTFGLLCIWYVFTYMHMNVFWDKSWKYTCIYMLWMQHIRTRNTSITYTFIYIQYTNTCWYSQYRPVQAIHTNTCIHAYTYRHACIF